MLSRKGLTILFLLVVMEMLAVFSVVIGVSLPDATTPGYALFWLLLLAAVVGAAAGLTVVRAQPPAPWDRIALLITGAAIVGGLAFLSSRGAVDFLAAAVILAVAYWRGLAATEEPPDHDEVQHRFTYGLGIFFIGIVLIVARGILDRHFVTELLAILGIAYVVTGLTALGLARLEQTREPHAGQAVLLAIGLQLGALFLISMGALVFFSHDIAAALLGFTRPFWDLLGTVLSDVLRVLLAPIIWLTELIRVHAHVPHPRTQPLPGAPQHPNPKRVHPHPTNSVWFTVGGILVVLAILAAIGVGIWRALPRLPRLKLERGYTEERESLFSLAAVWQALRAWLRALFRRGGRLAEEAVTATRHRIFGPEYPADPVRRLYAQLLRRAEVAGLPRALSLTPTEYQLRLTAQWPEGAAEFAALTDAYVLRRYGEVSFRSEEIETLKSEWQNLRLLLRRPTRPERLADATPIRGEGRRPGAGATPVGSLSWWRSGINQARRSPLSSYMSQGSLLRNLSTDALAAILAGAFALAVLFALFLTLVFVLR